MAKQIMRYIFREFRILHIFNKFVFRFSYSIYHVYINNFIFNIENVFQQQNKQNKYVSDISTRNVSV